ncbi:GAF domain-containing SpoIIE family protein phosphatase [Actinokineospora globicatena]|uniref:GAF domain-containing SpoIIE family protein phosphatase n=1 Tax=Actinokineospora globicatena TaxID=103729 RepID=UPI0020A4862B|nr:SpoIIE family protein phosphatase [Actinokineospora globicatena]MCP2303988.1 Serine phosphatase RsbU, regulator of sigma subunit [Actinokineospora globicatena]GLW78850.1 transcription antitermination regulator [Actinokineospora globicatena]GLW86737.1 transcription antitermination regulator [Actinokineospora globicatena]
MSQDTTREIPLPESRRADVVGRLAATVDRLRAQVRHGHDATAARGLVELATGVLVERLRCGPSAAAAQLAELAEQAGRTRVELAAEIVDEAARDELAEAARWSATVDDGVSLRLRTAESGALAAHDVQAVAESLLRHALAPLGAVGVAVWSAGGDSSLTLAGCAGFAADEGGRWRYVPPGVAVPARAALVKRDVEWVSSLAAAGVPSIGERDVPTGARAALPASTGGRVLGVLEVCWPHPVAELAPRAWRQLAALAQLCAHSLDYPVAELAPGEDVQLCDLADSLRDPALVLRPHHDGAGRVVDFRIAHVNPRYSDLGGRPRGEVVGALLLEAYPLAAVDGGLFERVEHVFATGEAFRADRVDLTALVGQVPLTAALGVGISRVGAAVLLVWHTEDEATRLANLLQHAQRLGRIGGFEENLATGEIAWNNELFALYGLPASAKPVPVEQLARHAHPDDAVLIGRFLRTLLHHNRPASTAFRLRRSDGVARHIRVIAEPVPGPSPAVRGAYQDISAQHWTEVALAATREQLAHSEQQAVESTKLTLQLQHAIMPPAQNTLSTPSLDVAVRYRPAEKDHLIGGDWYDAVVLPSSQILLCVGDIAGHGIEAATSMVVLRNALRGLAATGAGPSQLLTWLNLVTRHLTDHVTATAVCALFDPSDNTLRWARAGHLPPVLVQGSTATSLPLITGPLLGGLANPTYDEAHLHLTPTDTLLLYTDGLIERKDRTVEESLARLLTTAARTTSTLDQRLDRLLTHSNSDTDDDTCIIGVQLRAP